MPRNRIGWRARRATVGQGSGDGTEDGDIDTDLRQLELEWRPAGSFGVDAHHHLAIITGDGAGMEGGQWW